MFGGFWKERKGAARARKYEEEGEKTTGDLRGLVMKTGGLVDWMKKEVTCRVQARALRYCGRVL